MTNIKVRITILSLVFILSTVFFWLAINEYLLSSKAQQGSDLQIIPHSRTIECNPAGECYLHILGSTATDNAVAGVTGHVRYSEYLQPVRVDQVGLCVTSSYGTDTTLQFNDDADKKLVTFSVGSLRGDDELKGGNGCITTVVFKPVGVQSDPQEAKLGLTLATEWKAGGLIAGQRSVFQPQIDAETIAVKIDSSVPWPPTDQQPSGTPSDPTACQKEKGDCNCDNTIDLVDWEILRSSLRSEGGSCDVDGDGETTASDLAIWKENNDLVSPIIITKD